MTVRDRPKGTELDYFVLWAIADLTTIDVPRYDSTIGTHIATKTDRWEIDNEDLAFYNMVSCSLARIEKTGVIKKDEFDGWTLTPLEARDA